MIQFRYTREDQLIHSLRCMKLESISHMPHAMIENE